MMSAMTRARPVVPDRHLDCGDGGLTVLHGSLVSLPEEDYVYLGDDARFPYGAVRPPSCAMRRAQHPLLLDRGAKLIVIACNSAAEPD